MSNKRIELLNIFLKCFSNEISESEDLIYSMMDTDINKLDFHEICFSIFNLAEYIRITEKSELINLYKDQINDYVSFIIDNWNKEQKNCFNCGAYEIHTSNVAMAYGSLYNINLFLKDDKIAQLTHKIKNYVYENNISKGMLSNIKGGKDVALDMLISVIPFGLFAPEDLVMVESIKNIESNLLLTNGVKYEKDALDNCPISTLLLSWYFAEKSDYQKSKMYLSKVTIKNETEELLKKIVIYKLTKAKALLDTPIIHKPLGNQNRYNHQAFERLPWNPKDGEKVIINCVTWPYEIESGVKLYYTVNGSKEVALGNYSKELGNHSFEIGPFKGTEKVEYYFAYDDIKSSIYSYITLSKEIMSKVVKIEKYNNSNKIYFESDKGNYYLANIDLLDNQIEIKMTCCDFNIISEKIEKIESGKYKININDNSLISINSEEATFDIIDLFVWKDGDGVFSTGISMKTDENEGYYGFGERYNNLNQRGNIVDVYVYNQYKEQGIRTYFPMPYFISSKNYGLYLHSNVYTEFDLASKDSDIYSIETEMEELKITLFIGEPRDVIKQFVEITGKPVMLPEWAFGPWMSSNNWDSDYEVRKQVELTKKYDIPSTVLVIEAWSDESTYYTFNDASYEENNGEKAHKYDDFKFPSWGRWPDPKGLVNYLHDNNLKCILWQIPIIKYMNGLHHIQKDNDERYMISKGYCVKDENGEPYRMPEGWFTDSILFDYTSDEASKWWFEKRKYLVDDLDVDGFKTDGGEFVFGDESRFSNGQTGKEMRNLYPNLYVDKYFKFINNINKGITFSRAGFTGAQTMPAHWAGDERSTFDAFKRNLCAGLNAGLSGVPFWGWDLGGFSGEIPTAELYIRSTQMATFCPIMQYHAESKAEFNQDRTPWNIAERTNSDWVLDDYRYYAKLRMALMPYILEQADKSVNTGMPLMRALLIDFPEDKLCWNIFDQYMFGDDLLVAPIVVEDTTCRDVYLPEGVWVNIFTKEVFIGGKTYVVNANIHEIPVYQKQDSKWCFEINNNKFIVDEKVSE